MTVVAIGDRFDDAAESKNRTTASRCGVKLASELPDTNSGIREWWFDLHGWRYLWLVRAYPVVMTDSVPDATGDRPAATVDDGEYRQHASADVAPELFDDTPEGR